MKRQNYTEAKGKDSLSLRPFLTFSDELLIDTPYGGFVIKSALPGIWKADVEESTGPFNEPSENISMVHESLMKETYVPPLCLEAAKHSGNEIIYFYSHRNQDMLVDYYRIVFTTEEMKILN